MASDPKPTPGPWHMVWHPVWPRGANVRIARSPDEPWGNFGEIAYVAPSDAYLIRAAPDMYNALEAVVSVFTSRGDPGPDAQVEQAALDLAAVALAKARRKADE